MSDSAGKAIRCRRHVRSAFVVVVAIALLAGVFLLLLTCGVRLVALLRLRNRAVGYPRVKKTAKKPRRECSSLFS